MNKNLYCKTVLEKEEEGKDEYRDLTIDQNSEDREKGLFWLFVGNRWDSYGIPMTFEEFEKIKEVVEELKANQ